MTFDIYGIQTKHWGTYDSIKTLKSDLAKRYSEVQFRIVHDTDTIIVLDVNKPIAFIQHEITLDVLSELGISVPLDQSTIIDSTLLQVESNALIQQNVRLLPDQKAGITGT